MIANGKAGTQFYSDKTDGHLVAISAHHGRKIKTERLIAINKGGTDLNARYITKVTLL